MYCSKLGLEGKSTRRSTSLSRPAAPWITGTKDTKILATVGGCEPEQLGRELPEPLKTGVADWDPSLPFCCQPQAPAKTIGHSA